MHETVREDDLIFDVGMHNGEDTEFYLSRGFRVVGVEANPDLVRGLEKKFAAEIADGRVTIVDFIFTNCPFACPGMTGQMLRLQDKLAGTGARFLSVSVLLLAGGALASCAGKSDSPARPARRRGVGQAAVHDAHLLKVQFNHALLGIKPNAVGRDPLVQRPGRRG